MPFNFQDVTVTLIALAAAGVMVRRLLGFAGTTRSGPAVGCESCPSSKGACQPAAARASEPQPVVLLRRPIAD